MSASLADALHEGLSALGLSLDAGQQTALLAYLDWLARWNRVYNLTAVRDPREMLTHHLLDSLAVVAPLRRQLAAMAPSQGGARLLDVGSGGGLPGVVLAIACPDVRVSCVDTVAKKALFVQQVAAALRLPNVRGVHARVERLTETFDVVTSRAFASLADFVRWSGAALAPQGVWMAMKGKVPHEEMAALPPGVSVFHVEPLTVPGLEAQRCIVWMRKAAHAVADAGGEST
jgi:16S rRNA (guanine527-N7)-methyltransferase